MSVASDWFNNTPDAVEPGPHEARKDCDRRCGAAHPVVELGSGLGSAAGKAGTAVYGGVAHLGSAAYTGVGAAGSAVGSTAKQIGSATYSTTGQALGAVGTAASGANASVAQLAVSLVKQRMLQRICISTCHRCCQSWWLA
ncbi:hypothetical protein WJX72_004405 [[Myrmecia] bisecta]|uniref:Uncharacterized protein n=1 Tax=[Myrmecia] bisecta TaxID=41462 RepID=A0AAW1PT80_9CHLO